MYQYISIQNISSIHTFIVKIEQILGSHELKSHSPFWPKPGKNHWINFYLSWVCTSMQNQFIPSAHFWNTGHWPDWPHPFWPCPNKKSSNRLLICTHFNQLPKNQSIPSWDLSKHFNCLLCGRKLSFIKERPIAKQS